MLRREAAPAGSTGNNTHASQEMDSPSGAGVAFEFEVTAVGATPTVTYKWQASLDGTNWRDLAYITDAVDTLAVVTRARTTVSSDLLFLANPQARIYRYFRVVTTLNTNCTYRAYITVPD